MSGTAAASDKTYDGTTTASGTTLALSGFVGDETVSATVTGSTFNDKDVADASTVTVNSLSLVDGSDGNGGLASNYSLATGQTVAASITARALAVTADNQEIFFGEDLPDWTYVATGLVNDEMLVGVLEAAVGDPVEPGVFAITEGTLTNAQNPNYAVTFVEGQLTITMIPTALFQPPKTGLAMAKGEFLTMLDLEEKSEWPWLGANLGIAVPPPGDTLQVSALNP